MIEGQIIDFICYDLHLIAQVLPLTNWAEKNILASDEYKYTIHNIGSDSIHVEIGRIKGLCINIAKELKEEAVRIDHD